MKSNITLLTIGLVLYLGSSVANCAQLTKNKLKLRRTNRSVQVSQKKFPQLKPVKKRPSFMPISKRFDLVKKRHLGTGLTLKTDYTLSCHKMTDGPAYLGFFIPRGIQGGPNAHAYMDSFTGEADGPHVTVYLKPIVSGDYLVEALATKGENFRIYIGSGYPEKYKMVEMAPENDRVVFSMRCTAGKDIRAVILCKANPIYGGYWEFYGARVTLIKK